MALVSRGKDPGSKEVGLEIRPSTCQRRTYFTEYAGEVHLFSIGTVHIPPTRLKVAGSRILRIAVRKDFGEYCGIYDGVVFDVSYVVAEVHACAAERGLETLDTNNGEE